VTERSPSAECEADVGHCITCGDEGIPMRVLSAGDATAVCADNERRLHEVAVELLGPLKAGDLVLVHAGVAIGQPERSA
jgi:hydrogenase maturation factor